MFLIKNCIQNSAGFLTSGSKKPWQDLTLLVGWGNIIVYSLKAELNTTVITRIISHLSLDRKKS